MTAKWSWTRNRLMVVCALVAAVMLMAPVAMARGHYGGHGGRSGDVLGALIVGAVIGGVLVGATQHEPGYYGEGAYYPPQPDYAPQGYYGGNASGYAYPPTYPAYPAYPTRYAAPAYGTVSVGVVYSSGFAHPSYPRGRSGRAYNRVSTRGDYRGRHAGHRGYGNAGYRGGGHYYSHHGR